MPDVKSLRIPVRYLANLLTAGNEPPVVQALERMLAMRGDEHHRRHPVRPDVLDDPEAVAGRHLDIQEHEVRLLLLNGRYRL